MITHKAIVRMFLRGWSVQNLMTKVAMAQAFDRREYVEAAIRKYVAPGGKR